MKLIRNITLVLALFFITAGAFSQQLVLKIKDTTPTLNTYTAHITMYYNTTVCWTFDETVYPNVLNYIALPGVPYDVEANAYRLKVTIDEGPFYFHGPYYSIAFNTDYYYANNIYIGASF